MDVVDAVALLAFALASPEPTAVFSVVFAACGFVLCTVRALALCCDAACTRARSASASRCGPTCPGTLGGMAVGPLVGVFPTMFLTVVVGRVLAGSVRAREQAARLDAVHVSVGSQLLGVMEAAEIRRIAWAGYAGICAAMPGLRVLKVIREGAALRVDGATGEFASVPATLPAAVLSVLDGDGGTGSPTIQGHTELDDAVGVSCAWVCLSLPELHQEHGRAWLILGSPRSVSVEAVVAVESLANQSHPGPAQQRGPPGVDGAGHAGQPYGLGQPDVLQRRSIDGDRCCGCR
jgi:hypothetical protein